MSEFVYSLSLKETYLLVECSGVTTNLNELMTFSHTIMNTCTENNLTKVLMDSRWLKVKLSVYTKYEFANKLLEIAFIPKLQIAVVAGIPHWEREKDLELFLNNRSLPMYKVFPTMEVAKKWLFSDL